ncbi:hypothetical protein ACQKP1_23440 [Allorhizobium sp. NPDC080224]|uniref:hypothetical protein n=1 Tax=Allorhizobium sp. NPDC080224 TaxID=3390547 RepID=UPI003D02A908
MRRFLIPAFVGLVILAGLGGTLWWSIGTCRPLDRLLGLSGCTHRLELVDFVPLTHTTMAPTELDGMASLFGQVRTADGYQPGLIRLNVLTGREEGRYPLPIRNGFTSVVLSADGKRAAIGCSTSSNCLESDGSHAVIDITSGRLIETLDLGRDVYPRTFPGEAAPDARFNYHSQFIDNGQKVVTADGERRLVLKDLAGTEIAVLESTYTPMDNWLTVSPSSRYVAMLKRSDRSSPRVGIWDGRDGSLVASFQIPDDSRTGVAWANDEAAVFVVVTRGRQRFLQRFAF